MVRAGYLYGEGLPLGIEWNNTLCLLRSASKRANLNRRRATSTDSPPEVGDDGGSYLGIVRGAGVFSSLSPSSNRVSTGASNPSSSSSRAITPALDRLNKWSLTNSTISAFRAFLFTGNLK
ncbi:hypothetical protein UPYG_G00028480 [Umbra pygmaea]|uniref:Uncharacterized protein n=1 Tax=Umbra pygmaea TaxID=75934 RepID=A0ABD0XM83_UMBPY